MDAGLTTIDEADIAKHLPTAQSLVTRMVMMEAAESQSSTEIAGTGRRFVSTVSTGGLRKSREVEFIKSIQKIRTEDPMMSIGQHTLLFRARRGISDAMLRLSVGLEDTEDLIADLDQALRAALGR